jgi:hypothetical protein
VEIGSFWEEPEINQKVDHFGKKNYAQRRLKADLSIHLNTQAQSRFRRTGIA